MVESGSGGSTAATKYIAGSTGTLTAGQTSVNVAHALGKAPTWAHITPTNQEAVDLEIDWALTDATNLVVKAEFAMAADATFTWSAS